MRSLADNFYINRISFSLIVLGVTLVFSLLSKRCIDFIFTNVGRRVAQKTILARTKTIRTLLKSIIDVTLFSIAFLIILSHWGINIAPILTGAGIVGLVVSLGSQSLVKDIVSGFFIISDNEFNVGDRVKIANYEGEVDKITLRTTILRDEKGNLIYIPNSQITTIVRYTV